MICCIPDCEQDATHAIADGHGIKGGWACPEHFAEYQERFFADDLNRGAWFEAEEAHNDPANT